MCYRFEKDNYVSISNEGKVFDNELLNVGPSLDSAKIIEGYYEDGWTTPVTKLEMYTGENGKIILEGYYPFEINNENLLVDILIDGVSVKKQYINSNVFPLVLTHYLDKR